MPSELLTTAGLLPVAGRNNRRRVAKQRKERGKTTGKWAEISGRLKCALRDARRRQETLNLRGNFRSYVAVYGSDKIRRCEMNFRHCRPVGCGVEAGRKCGCGDVTFVRRDICKGEVHSRMGCGGVQLTSVSDHLVLYLPVQYLTLEQLTGGRWRGDLRPTRELRSLAREMGKDAHSGHVSWQNFSTIAWVR